MRFAPKGKKKKTGRPVCRECGSTGLTLLKPGPVQQALDVVFPVQRFQCNKCEKVRLEPVSLLRPAIWTGLVAVAVVALQPLSSERGGDSASTPTELKLDELKKPALAASDDLATATVAADEPASVYLGEDGQVQEENGALLTPQTGTPIEQNNGADTVAAAAAPAPAPVVEVFAPIMRAESGNFTIQVASTGTWADADKMMVKLSRRYNLNDEFFVYRSQAGGKLLFPVLYGNFDSSSQAKAAISGLPDHLRAGQPFIRKFGTVQRMLAQVSS